MKILFQLILLISRLPMRVHYFFSDILYVLVYHIVGYRKKVVTENLQCSFPEKSAQEIVQIRRKFYRNFSDYLVETIKAFTITSPELGIRVQHLNRQLFTDAKNDGKNVIILAGHVFNWEWFNGLSTMIPQSQAYAIYRRVNNPFWEKQARRLRSMYGNLPLEARETVKFIIKHPNDGDAIYMFVADQTPHISQITYGLKFLNQNTPAFVGYDKLAQKKDFVFLYAEMKKVKRGFYQVTYHRLYPDNGKFEPHEVVRKFHRLLENTIRKSPDNYLWSHRKWKYQDAVKHYDTQ